MFDLGLFRNRTFAAANIAGFLASIARGGVQIMLIILLEGIWLPLHGYSYTSTPFWSGIYILPLLIGFVVMGPISGSLADKYGSKTLTVLGMLLSAAAFFALTFLSYDFSYIPFAIIIFVMGLGSGLFASPNVLSIMNSVPPQARGVASGMRATLQNTGQTISLAIFFTIIIASLTTSLPAAFQTAMVNAGVPQLSQYFVNIPATSAVFAAFLGFNPVSSILAAIQPPSIVASIPATTVHYLTGTTFFPLAIAPAFMNALHITFYIGVGISLVAMLISYFRGKEVVAPDLPAKAAEQQRQAPVPVARGVSPDTRTTDEPVKSEPERGA